MNMRKEEKYLKSIDLGGGGGGGGEGREEGNAGDCKGIC